MKCVYYDGCVASLGKIRLEKKIWSSIGIVPIDDKMREFHLKWFVRVQQRPFECTMIGLGKYKRAIGRPPKTLRRVITKDINLKDLNENIKLKPA